MNSDAETLARYLASVADMVPIFGPLVGAGIRFALRLIGAGMTAEEMARVDVASVVAAVRSVDAKIDARADAADRKRSGFYPED